jgi:phage terminase small subunit
MKAYATNDEKTAKENGCKLLKKEKIRKQIEIIE